MHIDAELIARLCDEKVEQARQMTPDQKLLAGSKLYEELIERMIAGIKSQFPAFSNEQVQRELRRRLKINDQLEDQPWIQTKS